MRPLHEFTVASSLPPSLEPLVGLAANLHWAWDRQLIALFDRLDGTVGGPWRETDQHPVDLVRRTSPACWESLAADPDFVEGVAAARRRLDVIEARTGTWFEQRTSNDGGGEGDGGSPLDLVAYFSPEFGNTEAPRILRRGTSTSS